MCKIPEAFSQWHIQTLPFCCYHSTMKSLKSNPVVLTLYCMGCYINDKHTVHLTSQFYHSSLAENFYMTGSDSLVTLHIQWSFLNCSVRFYALPLVQVAPCEVLQAGEDEKARQIHCDSMIRERVRVSTFDFCNNELRIFCGMYSSELCARKQSCHQKSVIPFAVLCCQRSYTNHI